ncbi:MAG: hypothetical protein LH660_17410 [Phormidesmis sp. CAN_BIN36]|nr:hypothetical protein [Phormidesmis sp. CAN_BIN36]
MKSTLKSTPTKFILLAVSIASILFSTSTRAQDFGLPPILLQQSESFRNSDSQIVIRIRNFADRDAACGSGFNGSRLGISDGFDFPHPSGNGSEFPRSSRSNNFDFPRPGGSLNSFQLPSGSKNPDIVGCIDTQRNILFINIIRPQVKEQSQPTQTTSPVREQPPSPLIPQTRSTPPIDQTPIYNQNNPAGFYPVIR